VEPRCARETRMDSALWYFAYGSNLDSGTFLGRRRMRPLATSIGELRDFELRFDLPVGPGERGVANVAPRPGEHVWGALYRLTHADAERLDRTEGVGYGVYRRLAVEVDGADGAAIAAFTYRSELCRPERKPSRRYLGLLLTGARELALPPGWVERLRAWPLAIDERERQLELF
jgi:gamma-glutamylcyclotransferase